MTGALGVRIGRWLSNNSLQRKLALILAVLAIIAGVTTVAMLTGNEPIQNRREPLRWLLIIDTVLFAALSIVIGRRLVALWLARRRGQAGAGLQGRLVMLFSLIAITPAVLVAAFSYLSLTFGLEAWFNDRVSRAFKESVAVTDAYVKEHRENIANQAYSIGYVLNLNAASLMRNPWEFNRVLSASASQRELPEAVVIDRFGNILARSDFALSTVIEEIPDAAFAQADEGVVTLLGSERQDKVRAMIRLTRFVDAYLLVERFVDPRVLQHITGIRQAFDEYSDLQSTRSGIQISFVLIYLLAVMVLLMAAIWIGMTVSAQLAEPVTRLIGAADKVSKGDMDARVEADDAKDEIGVLSRAFNNMTEQIASQRQGLIAANEELDDRRRFTEAVLAGVSAGIVGLDEKGCINLPNRSASELLGQDLTKMIGQPLVDALPQIADLMARAKSRPKRLQQEEVSVSVEQDTRALLVRAAAEVSDGDVSGYVVTFDDVTELLSAQRKAAWADVARRIAHEIKNPLTPIQLSAERLHRKYLKEIESDPETFVKCTETIVRQVSDIGRMVDEFSSFARMPQPEMKTENLSELCRQAIFLERNRGTDVRFEIDLPDADIHVDCDARQISRVLTNVLKNAAESILGAREEKMNGVIGEVHLRMDILNDGERVQIVIDDDGRGLPSDQRDRLTEPYVTTRTRGTGLGLAIVKKIIEEHNGGLTLSDREPRGAQIVLTLPVRHSGIVSEDTTPQDQAAMKVATTLPSR